MTKKKTKVIVGFILDETGSMNSCKDTTISAFNEYVESLKSDKNAKYRFTLTKFNTTRTQVVHDSVRLKDITPLSADNYRPASTTPLYDAVGSTIRSIQRAVRGMDSKPAVLVTVMTDGLENASREWDRDMVFKLIEKRKKKGWEFAFLGADQDAYAEAAKIGMPMASTLNYQSGMEKGVIESLSVGTRQWTSTGAVAGTFSLDDNSDK